MSRMRTWAVGATLAVVLGSSSATAFAAPDSSGTWILLSDPGPAPPTFEIPLGAYDPVRNRLIVIETGLDGRSQPISAQALAFDPEPRWSALAASGTPPLGRFLASLIYDPIRDRLLLFAGWGMNDVWALTLSGTPTWQQVATTGSPPPWRGGHSAIYDPIRDRMIVFGGYASAQPSGVAYDADTWALSLQSNTWSTLTPSGAPPPAREGHGAIYDPDGDRMLVFAGHDAAGLRNDLWALSLGDNLSWSEIQAGGPIPAPRSAFGAIYDPVRHLMWIQGGVNPDEVWNLSLTGTPAWTAIATLDTLRGRSYPVDFYDPRRDRLVAFGGASYAQTSALPLAGPYRWTQFLPPQPPLVPGPRSQHAVVYNSRLDRFMTFGGSYGSTDINMWSFVPGDTGVWSPIPAPASPSGWSTAAVYDSLGDRIILYDGVFVWTLSLTPGSTWEQIDPDGLRARVGASVILDPRRNRVILYGGYFIEPHISGYTVSEVWSLSLDGTPSWTLLGYGPEPRGSTGHTAFYDPLRDRMVVMGGYSQNGNSFKYPYGPAVWASPLDSTLRWTILTSPIGPQPVSPPWAQMVYDPLRDRMLVFADSTVWSRSVDDTGPWTLLDATGPRPVVSAPVVFDPIRDQALALFSAVPGAALDQAWAFSFGPPLISLLHATATFDQVEIAWHSSGARGRPATIERREEVGEWAQIASLAFDETGTLVVRDHGVSPGVRYAYRVGVLEDSGRLYSDSTWVEIPPRPTLALQGACPNPTVRAFNVVFSLPDAAPARLDVFDVRGGRISAREVGGLGPGTHTVDLAPERPLPPGVYLIRLGRAGQSFTARAVVIR